VGTLIGIAYADAALRSLAAIEPKKIRQQIKARIDGLAQTPRPAGCTKLQNVMDGSHEVYRIRQGDYRVLYVVKDNEILVLDIGHRKDVYRNR
jgi:mRNA interferase RelE/StbE